MDLGLWNAAQCVRGDLARSMWGTVENQSVCRTGLRPVHPVWGGPPACQRDTAATNLQFSSPLVARRAMTGRLSIGLFLLTATLSAQLRPDPQLSAEIARIKAIDNHAHPVRIVAPNEKDMEFDALPVDTMDPYTEPIRTRPESGEATQAHKALYGAATRKSVMDKQGDNYPNWVLDQLGIDVMLANRVAMGTSIAPPRFLWVPYADALMYPLKNDVLIARAPDYKELFADEERLLQRYLK